MIHLADLEGVLFIWWSIVQNGIRRDNFVSYSYIFLAGVDLRGYLGFRAGLNVLGLLNWTVVRTFFTLVPWVPFTTFFCTFCAFCTVRRGAFFTFSSVFFSTGFFGTGTFLAGAALAEKWIVKLYARIATHSIIPLRLRSVNYII